MVLKINFAKPIINNNALENIAKVIESGRLSHGPFIDQFESEFAKYTGSPGAVSVSSCTTGLNLCYSLCGVGPDSEVIVPALTHVATAHAAAHLSAASHRLGPDRHRARSHDHVLLRRLRAGRAAVAGGTARFASTKPRGAKV